MSSSESSLDVTEARAAAVATAPRITKEFIEEQINTKLFMTGDQFLATGSGMVPSDLSAAAIAHLTICLLRVNNGFLVIGKSAPMNPRNFDGDLGRQLAYEDAFRQLWPLYAFAHLEDVWVYEDSPEARGGTPFPHDDGEVKS